MPQQHDAVRYEAKRSRRASNTIDKLSNKTTTEPNHGVYKLQ